MEDATKYVPQSNPVHSLIPVPLVITSRFIAKVLTPYKEHVKYLQSAKILDYYEPDCIEGISKEQQALVTIEGNFAIPESCYIDNTGHFNSVEFNICYNQLAYVLFGKCFQLCFFDKWVSNWKERVNLTFEKFLKYQLSASFIVKIEGNFLKPLSSKKFQAKLAISRVKCFHETAFFYTQISFGDTQATKSKGAVLLAFRIYND